ncbi:DUF4914 family protein [Saccharicrinis aurantiacus]|uniref:DUF4914 family protein n=1 Tax=Saccharicrinis aurantiacus TaxID=1849719 RepID=UPI0008388C64|nr:DUF4914 family protein [Saccharicrinis aurantiacus]
MTDLQQHLEKLKIALPDNVATLLNEAKSVTFFNSTEELANAATNGKENLEFEVKYDVPGKGEYTEAVVHRVKNGISANYTESYMRRRDPGTMAIADDKPTDKTKFKDKFGYEFSKIQGETFEWMKAQDLAVFFYFAGRAGIGSLGIAIAPANAGFFALGLAMLQEMKSLEDLKEGMEIKSSIFVAPVFRHTHFEGKQVVVHNRTDEVHELYSYNLYPGPSAKKGVYGVLLTQGEKEGWVTAHCSAVEAISPYDNITTFMHEGASGGGKSELHQHLLREPEGGILLGQNIVTGETKHVEIPKSCAFRPVADDMAFCHPSVQEADGKLRIVDAENSWFVRVDSVNEYGDDPTLEKTCINPKEPLLFLNIDTNPDSTALIWDHIEDEPGKKCPNPRVVIPRKIMPNVIDRPVAVDVRSFGLRAPQCTKGEPTYGIAGMFHILPPALAWLWRLVAPRGHKNPSIVSDGSMQSEGVGSYWPFATGKKVDHANMLLKQIIDTPRTTFTLVPNQNIGSWKVGFKPQLLMREYMTRRGAAKLREDQYQDSRCPLLGYELNYLTIEGSKIPKQLLKVYKQPEVGVEGYDAGAAELTEFFKKELKQYLQPGLMETGRKIIEACLNDATIEEYNQIVPMSFEYDYSFKKVEDFK